MAKFVKKEVSHMVAIQNPQKCPNCGSSDFDFVQPTNGTSYVLTTVDQSQNPPTFNPINGLPVFVIGCVSCGNITLHVPSLRRE
jgi:acyl-homoserine lactone acylase PvdQ